MAADRVNSPAPLEQTTGPGAQPVECRHCAGPELRLDPGGGDPGLSARPQRAGGARTATRLVSRCRTQAGCQTWRHAAVTGGDHLLCPLTALGRHAHASRVSPVGAGDGRLDPGPTLHHPLHIMWSFGAARSRSPGTSSIQRPKGHGTPIGKPCFRSSMAAFPTTGR